MRFEFIAAEKAGFPVAALCRAMQVAPSGFYAWAKRPPSRRSKEDVKLKVHIKASHKKSRKTYGSPRIHKDLMVEGIVVGQKRVARLMREDGLRGTRPKKFKVTTNSKHNKPVAPNILNRDIAAVTTTNKVWVSDITYIWTGQGWLYLAVMIDVFSRRIVGYQIDDHMRAELVTDALNSAIEARDIGTDLMHHSDRGSQYVSDNFLALAHKHKITLSMSRKGNCWDNAVAESFFASLKKDLIYRQSWFSKKQVTDAINEYIVWYNRERRHSSLGYLSPADYERLTMLAMVA